VNHPCWQSPAWRARIMIWSEKSATFRDHALSPRDGAGGGRRRPCGLWLLRRLLLLLARPRRRGAGRRWRRGCRLGHGSGLRLGCGLNGVRLVSASAWPPPLAAVPPAPPAAGCRPARGTLSPFPAACSWPDAGRNPPRSAALTASRQQLEHVPHQLLTDRHEPFRGADRDADQFGGA
jgi:hypothetical protein